MDTTNSKLKKTIIIAACAVLVLVAGTITALAATGSLGELLVFENGKASVSYDDGETWQDANESGYKYSLDGGETWNDGLPPEGNEENALIINGEIPDDSVSSFAVKTENGVELYSTDGGQSWSETPPDGTTVNGDGSVSYQVTTEG